ncbi:formate dehydrogenase subunit gamma [Dyella halodurans]|uniref:Formate dehydrogenase subunit gamma n=1 Tax=Dyella halodurans TaxID=1920171 RepID=A0ABV9C2K1_9GAMM|nr:formate dehydrogenase subunit gamma [Dyella halodurans]
MSRPKNVIIRYSATNRVNHWITAICFVLLVLSGLAMFHPMLFFLSGLFGGGQWMRAAHPWIGIVLLISYLAMIVQFWRENLVHQDDIEWLKQARFIVSNQEERAPQTGRNNAGQKIVFWSMALLIPVLFFTGLLIWEVYFGAATSIPVQRAAVLIHSLAAIAAILVWIVHVFAAIWVRDSVRAMTQGYVTPGWAWRHHRKWLEELASGQHDETNDRKRP